jgi:Rrf2 family protein
VRTVLVLSMQTDYAILALGYLSRAPADRLIATREIATRYNIPAELLAKVLQRLAREGMVRSNAGPAGGYALGLSLDRVSVADVLRAIEGPLHVVRCTGEVCCNIAPTCDIVEPMRVVHERVVRLLEEIKVAELVGARAEVAAP